MISQVPNIHERTSPELAELLLELASFAYYDGDLGHFVVHRQRNSRVPEGDTAGCDAGKGYIHLHLAGTKWKEHRLVWAWFYGLEPTDTIDHINHNQADNRIENLQELSHTENARKRIFAMPNASGYTGVYWSADQQRWHAHMWVNKHKVHIGSYKTKEEAITAYEQFDPASVEPKVYTIKRRRSNTK